MPAYKNTLAYARQLDRDDPLRVFRRKFHIPQTNGKKAIYLCGNSLGLQPIDTARYLTEELSDWAEMGVDGHVKTRRPWVGYHKLSKAVLKSITGARSDEVVAMNHLTVNLHLMLAAFYRPDKKKYKIIAEKRAFSSDMHALASQVQWHGLDPDKAIIELCPRQGEHCLRTSDIVKTIKQHKGSLCLVLLGAVQYYTGQFFDIPAIARAIGQSGAYLGLDLAHAIGNVPLNLHRDKVDFAIWCSYKYLNAGPGAVGGAFVHQKHGASMNRLSGWWGHRESDRFLMEKKFLPANGIDGWQLSNFPVLSGAALQASLEIFREAGMGQLRKKSLRLSGYLLWLLGQFPGDDFEVITPHTEADRGCQVSVLLKRRGKAIHQFLLAHGVRVDWREPGVIRLAPVPLYNTFEEVYRFGKLFQKALQVGAS